jgi:tellurium resistance protein TerZ
MSLLSLDKGETPQALTVDSIAVGAEWDAQGAKNALMNAFRQKKGADLDLLAVLFQRGRAVRYAGWKNLNPLKDNTVTHTGDNQTGAGEGDDEKVEADLANVPAEVDKILFVIGTKEKNFGKASNVSFNMYDTSSGTEEKLAPSIWPELGKDHNAVAVCAVERAANGWTFKLLEKFAKIQFSEAGLLEWANQVGKGQQNTARRY